MEPRIAAGLSQDWAGRHYSAIQSPRGIERPIVAMRSALLEYALEYAQAFEGCELGHDYVLGDAWRDAASAYVALLNGPTGRLDCGSLDGEIRHWAKRFGFSEQEADQI